jgi:citrate/tricarballylate utilization protein
MPPGDAIPRQLVEEGARAIRLCNACRHCEGFCAVFPALERRLDFVEADLTYLANLCHNCGECYHACQYAPPHEFALSLSRTLAEIRGASYRKYARPLALGGLLARGGLAALGATLLGTLLFLGAVLARSGLAGLTTAHPDATGAFHALISHGAMVAIFGAAAVWIAVALALGVAAFWRDTGERPADLLVSRAAAQGLWDSLRLRYLEGGGHGCASADDVPTHSRRRLHQLTVAGFALCFASTTVAAAYHYLLGSPAPYPRWSLPVALGTIGGLALMVGSAGLLWLKIRRNPALVDPAQSGQDMGFLALLGLTSLTGLLLMALRQGQAMGALLVLHMGLVLGLFVTMPYGKFVHAVYRYAALVRHALEQRRPRPRLGSE